MAEVTRVKRFFQCQVRVRRGPGGSVPTCLFSREQAGQGKQNLACPLAIWREKVLEEGKGKKHVHA